MEQFIFRRAPLGLYPSGKDLAVSRVPHLCEWSITTLQYLATTTLVGARAIFVLSDDFISIRVSPFGVGSMEPYDVSAITLWIHSVSGHCISVFDFIDFSLYPYCSLEHRSLLGHWLQTLVTLGIIAYGQLYIALATPMIWGDFIYLTLWCLYSLWRFLLFIDD